MSPSQRSPLPRLAAHLGLLTSLLCAPSAFAEVQAENGYVRAVPAGHSISAAYLTLRNNADTAVQLNSVHSDSAGTVELHQTREQDGVMRMRAAKQVEIAPGTQYHLQPGGDHLMLIDLKQPLNAGDKVKLNLSFSDGQQLQLTLPVRSPAEEAVMSGDNKAHTLHTEPAQSNQHKHGGTAHSH
jgi:periplasmic copper chaperone A